MQFVIVTGMSGAGKSMAVNALEDIGFYCVDNMPPRLIVKFAQLCLQAESMERIAVVVDARGREMFPELIGTLLALEKDKIPYKVLFLESNTNELINRYKITRRRHPLLGEETNTLNKAILSEREMLADAKNHADYILDTSLLSVNQLKKQVRDIFSGGQTGFIINCMSFGFKFGVPSDADLIFDVRCLPNPFYEEALRPKTGLEKDVQDFVLCSPKTQGFLERLYSLIDYMLPLYRYDENKSQLTIGIGCTGGHHRSVTIALELEKHLLSSGYNVFTSHRDIDKKKL